LTFFVCLNLIFQKLGGGEGCCRAPEGEYIVYGSILIQEVIQIMNNIELEHVKTNSIYDFKEIYDSYAYNVEESRHNCQYYEISEMYKKFQEIESDHFTTLSLNIRSLPGKFLEFKNFLDSINFSKFKPAVICLQEIWNKPQYESFLLENYHDFQFKIRDKTGINSNQGEG